MMHPNFSKNGEKEPLIWLSILGKVYDVTEGTEYYGPGQSYNSLTAADTSVPFVSGTFTPEEAKKDPGMNDTIHRLEGCEVVVVKRF